MCASAALHALSRTVLSLTPPMPHDTLRLCIVELLYSHGDITMALMLGCNYCNMTAAPFSTQNIYQQNKHTVSYSILESDTFASLYIPSTNVK